MFYDIACKRWRDECAVTLCDITLGLHELLAPRHHLIFYLLEKPSMLLSCCGLCFCCPPFYNRQMLDSAVRAHRKHMTSIQSAVSKFGLWEPDKDQTPPPRSPESALEKGNCYLCAFEVTPKWKTKPWLTDKQ